MTDILQTPWLNSLCPADFLVAASNQVHHPCQLYDHPSASSSRVTVTSAVLPASTSSNTSHFRPDGAYRQASNAPSTPCYNEFEFITRPFPSYPASGACHHPSPPPNCVAAFALFVISKPSQNDAIPDERGPVENAGPGPDAEANACCQSGALAGIYSVIPLLIDGLLRSIDPAWASSPESTTAGAAAGKCQGVSVGLKSSDGRQSVPSGGDFMTPSWIGNHPHRPFKRTKIGYDLAVPGDGGMPLIPRPDNINKPGWNLCRAIGLDPTLKAEKEQYNAIRVSRNSLQEAVLMLFQRLTSGALLRTAWTSRRPSHNRGASKPYARRFGWKSVNEVPESSDKRG